MKKSLSPLIIMIGLTVLASCGKSGGGGGGNSSSQQNMEKQEAEGSYRAILRPFNNSLSGFLPSGAAEIEIIGDQVSVKTYLDDDARVQHIQSIHTGSRCPDARDDRNRDGLVDIEESRTVVGEVLVPLDADLNSAAEGAGIYPIGGGFTYTEQAQLSNLEEDVKARTKQNLNLDGRVVLVQGVARTTLIPMTVKSMDNLSPQATIPITCGILQRQ